MLFAKLVHISFRSQMQYPASIWMLTISYFLSTFVDIVGLWVLLERFKVIHGWTLQELCLVYGIVHMGFALAETFGKGFDNFNQMVKQGDFDRLLLRPIGTLMQIAGSQAEWMRLGRFFQGLAVILWGAHKLHISFFSLHTLVIFFSVISAASLFYGLLIIQAALSFWVTEALTLKTITSYGGLLAGQFPITIFSAPIRLIFTFLIPIACVGYYPTATLLKHTTLPLPLGLAAPLAGFVFLWLAYWFWRLGVRRYVSTGS